MKQFLLLFPLLASIVAMAQVKVSGKIKDNKGKPIPGISITLKDTYDGSVSDSSGNFNFSTTEKGTHIIEVTGVGYHSYTTPVDVQNAPVVLDISLKERLDELKAVIVMAGSFEAGDKKRGGIICTGRHG
jgi:hypothetical protein